MAVSIAGSTTVATGTAVDFTTVCAQPRMIVSLTGGTPTSLQVALEGSIDNSAWSWLGSIDLSALVLGGTTSTTLVAAGGCRYVRARIVGVTQPAAPAIAGTVRAEVYGV